MSRGATVPPGADVARAVPLGHRLIRGAAVAVAAVARTLPAPLAYGIADVAALGIVAWTAVFERPRRGRARSSGFYHNYGIVYRDAAQPRHRRRLLRAWSRHLAHLVVDFCRQPLITAENYREFVDVTGFAHMRDVAAEHGNVIVATAHVGVFELCGYIAPFEGIRTAAVFNPARIRPVAGILDRIRAASGAQILPREGATRAMLRTLAAGINTGFAVDVATKHNPVFVPFLGTLAATNRTVALLHLRTGLPIVVLTVSRTGRMRFRAHVWDVIEHDRQGDHDAAVIAIMTRVNAALSRAIHAYPEQWFWHSRRFRYRPPGENRLPNGLPPMAEPAELLPRRFRPACEEMPERGRSRG